MDFIRSEASLYFNKFVKSISKNLKLIADRKLQLSLPHIPTSFLSPFLKEMRGLFEKEPPLLELDGSFVIVGDLHGHFLDLCRIFKNFKYPNTFKYVFLGDVVDRGEFSFETILLILLMKYFYPNSVYLIRGNHEFRALCLYFGFLTEIKKLYPNENIFDQFIDIFDNLPLAAILQKQFFCVHGGICPELNSLEKLQSLKKPITDFSKPLICGLVWSDPLGGIEEFEQNERGSGYFFGEFQIQHFLERNHLKMLIRAHQCVSDGIQYDFDHQVATVFSASNYCGHNFNKSGVLIIKEDGKIQTQIFQSFQYIMRDMVTFRGQFVPKHLMPRVILNQRLLLNKKLISDMQQKKQHFHRNSVMSLNSINV
jgi:protein phosphatase